MFLEAKTIPIERIGSMGLVYLLTFSENLWKI